MKFNQVKYVTAATPEELQIAVNDCMVQDNRWTLQGTVNVFDKPDVTEPVTWVQTLLRYVEASELVVDQRPDM